MAFLFKQRATGAIANGATAPTLHFASGTTQNDRCIVVVNLWVGFATPAVTSISDAKGNSYNADVSFQYTDGNFTGVIAIFSANLATALAATDNVTAHLNLGGSGQTGGRWAIIEYGGLSTAALAADVAAHNTSGGTAGTAASVGPTLGTGAADELALVAYGDDGYVAAWTAAPAGTARVNVMSDGTADLWVGEVDSGVSGSTLSSSGTLSTNANWGMAIVIYQLAAVAPSNPAWVGQYRSPNHWRRLAAILQRRAGVPPRPGRQPSPVPSSPTSRGWRRRLPPRRQASAPTVFPPQPQPPMPVMPASTPRRRLAIRPAPRWAPVVPGPVLPQGPVYIAPPQARRPPPAVLPRRAQPPRVPGQARPPAIMVARPYLSRPVLRRRRAAPLVLPLVPPPVMLMSPARRPSAPPRPQRQAPMVFPFVAPPVPPAFLQAPPRVRTHVEVAWHRPPGLVPTAAIQPAPVPPAHCTPSVGPNWQWIDGYCCQQMAGSRIVVDGGHVAVTNRVVWVDGVGQAYDPARP